MNENELAPEQYQAIEKFASELKTCFFSYKNTHPDAFSDIVLNYVMQVIDIHVSLAELKTDRYLCNMAREFEGQVK